MRKELEAALDLAENLPADELPRLVGELEEIRCIALMRLTTRETKSQTDELLDVHEVAALLHMSTDWVYRRARKLPFFCENGSSRALRFSAAKLDLYLKQKSR
jgi:predicted DNA-binding transcriptional regulator AlpA